MVVARAQLDKPPMKILVTGARGFVGRSLCRNLEQHGFRVRSALRRASSERVGEEVVLGDIGPRTEWREALRGVDVVVHLAARVHVMDNPARESMADYRAVNVEGTRCLAESAAAAGVRRLVFLSSLKVNGEAKSQPYSEADPPEPEGPYAKSKWEAEQALREVAAKTGLEWTVLRPPLVYGPGVGANFERLMSAVAHRIPLPLGAVRNRRSLLFLGNLVDAVRVCLTHTAAANATFLLRDGEDISTPDLVRRLARSLGVAPVLLPVPVGLLHLAARLTGRQAAVERLTGTLRIDDSLVRRRLGWKSPFALDEGLAETARWYRATRRAQRVG
jgi:nucleoside-diphosphate-sugar epimerase